MRTIKTTSRFSAMHLSMIAAVLSFVFRPVNMLITSSIPAWLNLMNRIKTKYDGVEDYFRNSELPATGVAQLKRNLRLELANLSASIMQAVYSFARQSNNPDLANKVKFSYASLKAMRNNTFISTISAAINVTNEHIGQLEDYGITPESVDAWKSLRDTFVSVIEAPKNAHVNQNQTKTSGYQELNQIIDILYNEADPLARQFINDHNQYYREYRANRKLYPHHVHTKFRLIITDELNQPIQGVKLQQDDSPAFTFSGPDGLATLHIEIKPGKKPSYSFTATHGQHTIRISNITIPKGKSQTRTIIMQPSGFTLPNPQPEHVLTDLG